MSGQHKNCSFDSLDQVQQKKLAVQILLWFYKEKLKDLPDSMRNDLKCHVHKILKSHATKTSFHSPKLNSSHASTSALSGTNTTFLELPSATKRHALSSKKEALKMLCATDSDSDLSVLRSLDASNSTTDIRRFGNHGKHLKFSKRKPVSCSTPEKVSQTVMTVFNTSQTSSKKKSSSSKDEKFNETPVDVIYVHDKACQVGSDLEELIEDHTPIHKAPLDISNENTEKNPGSVSELASNSKCVADSSEGIKNVCFEIAPPVQCNPLREPEQTKPVAKSVAWYEPYQYQPPWSKKKEETAKPVRSTLQEALSSKLPSFVSRSQERQRRIRISAEERKLEEVWSKEREQVFGFSSNTAKYSTSSDIFKRLQLNQKKMVTETTKKYKKLPEVIERKERLKREKIYAENRQKAIAYKKRIQNQVIGRAFCA